MASGCCAISALRPATVGGLYQFGAVMMSPEVDGLAGSTLATLAHAAAAQVPAVSVVADTYG